MEVALAASSEALAAPGPGSGWRLTERLSGDRFQMGDLRGGSSEFEIFLAARA